LKISRIFKRHKNYLSATAEHLANGLLKTRQATNIEHVLVLVSNSQHEADSLVK